MREVEEQESVAPKKKKKKLVRANRGDYFRLYYEVLGDLKRDLLSGSLMTKTTGKWEPAINYLNVLGSEAADYADSKGIDYSQQLIEKHFSALEFVTEPELLINIPVWDGVDRIKEIASVVTCSNVSQDHFYELILQFGVTIFERLYDPSIQPITPIMQGGQAVGKDTLCKALVGGLDFYFRKLNVGGYDLTEAARQLHTGIVFHIPEFDRTTRKKDAEALKDLLSDEFTDVRLPWGKAATKRDVRCSFIASTNAENVLTDKTGGRRFWVFKVTYAGFNKQRQPEKTYPGHFARPDFKKEQLQMLAQFKEMKGYRASQEAVSAMETTVLELTPDDQNELCMQEFDARIDLINAIPARNLDGIPYNKYGDIKGIIADLGKEFNLYQNTLLSMLKRTNRQRLFHGARLYCAVTSYQLSAVTPAITDIPF